MVTRIILWTLIFFVFLLESYYSRKRWKVKSTKIIDNNALLHKVYLGVAGLWRYEYDSGKRVGIAV